MKIELRGNVLEGDKEDLAVILRNEPYYYSQQRIADILGVSKMSVSTWLTKKGYSGWLDFNLPELKDKELFKLTDLEIAKKLNLPVAYVTQARLRLGIKKKMPVRLQSRRKRICYKLFGSHYKPGRFFNNYLLDLIDNFATTEIQKGILIDFYILGKEDKDNSRRIYRSRITDRFKVDKDYCIKNEVIIEK